MRIYLTLTKSRGIIPFNYQPYLTGAIHKWIGEQNDVHDAVSLYTFSWLQNVEVWPNKGVNLTSGSYFFISAFDDALIKRILKGVREDPSVCYGSYVSDVQIAEAPSFSNRQSFFTASPVFIKRRIDDHEKHITFDHPQSGEYLTETLVKKMKTAGLDASGVHVQFDSSYFNPKTKIIRYNQIGNRVSVCPVIVEGRPEQIAFAWNVGVGNSTGIGFGSLK